MPNKINFKELEDAFKLIKSLNRYYLEFGILNEDEYKTVEVSLLNPDNTETEVLLSLGEIMYFTEFGTIMIPARPILQNTLMWAAINIDRYLDEIVDGVFNNDWGQTQIETSLNLFARELETQAKQELSNYIITSSNLANLLNIQDENKYIYDLNKLKNYIKCKLIKK